MIDERGRKELEGHIIRQVGIENAHVLLLERFLEFIDDFAFGGHG